MFDADDPMHVFYIGIIAGLCLCGVILILTENFGYTPLDNQQYKCTDERIVNHNVVCYQYSRTEEK